MSFFADSRRRAIALQGAGLFLVLAVFGALQAFNTSNIGFLNPNLRRDAGLTGLTVVVFLLLLVLLMLLLRNILKLYADQSSSALGSRLRTRMVLGAALIALAPRCSCSYSVSADEPVDRQWFSPNTSELREDSTRVVLELAQYVTSNARARRNRLRRRERRTRMHRRSPMCWPLTGSLWMAGLPSSTAGFTGAGEL